jgi:excisionase family DNA binding protein
MSESETEKQTVTVDEAARRLGLGRNATYEAVRKGEVPALRIGKRWLVPIAVLNRMLKGEVA